MGICQETFHSVYLLISKSIKMLRWGGVLLKEAAVLSGFGPAESSWLYRENTAPHPRSRGGSEILWKAFPSDSERLETIEDLQDHSLRNNIFKDPCFRLCLCYWPTVFHYSSFRSLVAYPWFDPVMKKEQTRRSLYWKLKPPFWTRIAIDFVFTKIQEKRLQKNIKKKKAVLISLHCRLFPPSNTPFVIPVARQENCAKLSEYIENSGT